MQLLQGGIQHSCSTFYTQLTQNKYKPDGKVMKGKHAVDQEERPTSEKHQASCPGKRKCITKRNGKKMAQTRVFMTKHWETGYSWLVRLQHKEEHVTRLASDKCCLLTKEEIKPKGWATKERAREWVGMSCVCHQTATPVKSGQISPKVHMQHKKTVAVIVIRNRFKHFQPHVLCLEEKAVAVGLREATVDFG